MDVFGMLMMTRQMAVNQKAQCLTQFSVSIASAAMGTSATMSLAQRPDWTSSRPTLRIFERRRVTMGTPSASLLQHLSVGCS